MRVWITTVPPAAAPPEIVRRASPFSLFSHSPRGVVPTVVEADGGVTVGLDGHG